MSKIDAKYLNPFDNFLTHIFDKYVSNFFYACNLTPNMITTLGLLSAVISMIYFLKEVFILSGGFFLVSYFFDCADGYYARKYNMTSKYGDYYDHIVDLLKLLSFGTIVLYKLYSSGRFLSMVILIFIALMTGKHVSYQEYVYNNTKSVIESPTLKFTSIFSNEKNINVIKQKMRLTRYLADGTFFLYFTYLIVSL